MLIVGCDFHTRYQQNAMAREETAEIRRRNCFPLTCTVYWVRFRSSLFSEFSVLILYNDGTGNVVTMGSCGGGNTSGGGGSAAPKNPFAICDNVKASDLNYGVKQDYLDENGNKIQQTGQQHITQGHIFPGEAGGVSSAGKDPWHQSRAGGRLLTP